MRTIRTRSGGDHQPTLCLVKQAHNESGQSTPKHVPPIETANSSDSAALRSRARTRFTVLSLSHSFIDVFPVFFLVLMLPLESRLNLTAWQVNVVYMATPIFSGTFQPLFAWLSDRYNTRIFSPLGVLIGAVCVASIGFANTFEQLLALQIVGVIATGFYHPVSTALAGQSGSRAFQGGRAFAVGLFIAAGMLGQTISARLTPEIAAAWGIESLAWLIVPGVLGAIVLHQVVRHIPHKNHEHHADRPVFTQRENRTRWFAVGSLTVQNALRFTANVGVFALFNVFAGSLIADPAEASKLSGTLVAFTTLGMGISVIAVGRLARKGHERLWLTTLSATGAVFVGATGYVGYAVLPTSLDAAPSLAAIALIVPIVMLGPLGFFSTFPITASLGQRLQPAHTSLVTSLLMGLGWAVSALHAPLAGIFLGASIKEATSLPPAEISIAFVGFAVLLVLSAVLALSMPAHAIQSVADDH